MNLEVLAGTLHQLLFEPALPCAQSLSWRQDALRQRLGVQAGDVGDVGDVPTRPSRRLASSG